MSILNPIPQDILEEHFVYKGLFLGIVPVYLGPLTDEAPELCEQDGIPAWCLDLALLLAEASAQLAIRLGVKPKNPLGWNPVKITSRIDGKPLAQDRDYNRIH